MCKFTDSVTRPYYDDSDVSFTDSSDESSPSSYVR